jgi:adenosine deaminase
LNRVQLPDPSFPIVELHRHLDGNIRLQTIIDLAHQHNIPLPAWDINHLRPYVQVTDTQPGVMAFIAKFHWPMAVLMDGEACRRVAYENVGDAKREGVDYIELRFSPWFMAEANGLDPFMVAESVVDGISEGVHDFGVKVNLIGILSRTYGTEIATTELNALLSQRNHITALDLAGDEAHFPPEWFRWHFDRARDVGWHITVHAGEFTGAESIWHALLDLKAERIGHALSATEDECLMDYMAENRISIESCLTSNVQTSCVVDYTTHPIKTFLEHGICASISTDDPGISGIDLSHEYHIAAHKAKLTEMQIFKLQVNALNSAFLSEDEKMGLKKDHKISRGGMLKE